VRSTRAPRVTATARCISPPGRTLGSMRVDRRRSVAGRPQRAKYTTRA